MAKNSKSAFAIIKVSRPTNQRLTQLLGLETELQAMVEKQQIMSDLLREFPQFQTQWNEYSRQWGQDAGPCLGMAVFAHFVIDVYEQQNYERAHAAFGRMEEFLKNGSPEVRDLIGLGFLQTLQNVALLKPYGSEAFVRFLGVETGRVWAQLDTIWRTSVGMDLSDRTTLEAEVLVWRMVRAALHSEKSVRCASSS